MKQPVLAAGGFASLLQAIAALIVHYGYMNVDEVGLWMTLFTIAGTMGAAWWASNHSMAVVTLNEAGMTKGEIQAKAADPDVPAAKEPAK